MLPNTPEPGLAKTDTCGNLLEQEYLASGLEQTSNSQSQHQAGVVDALLSLLLGSFAI